MNDAVAGFLWAALASPDASFRWQAAHAVKGVCILGRQKIIESLINLAVASDGGAFADARLHFYRLHARLWLLIALSRSALDNPEILAPHSDFFIHHALDAEPHVLIRADSGLSDSGAGFTIGLRYASPLSRSGGGEDGASIQSGSSGSGDRRR